MSCLDGYAPFTREKGQYIFSNLLLMEYRIYMLTAFLLTMILQNWYLSTDRTYETVKVCLSHKLTNINSDAHIFFTLKLKQDSSHVFVSCKVVFCNTFFSSSSINLWYVTSVRTMLAFILNKPHTLFQT